MQRQRHLGVVVVVGVRAVQNHEVEKEAVVVRAVQNREVGKVVVHQPLQAVKSRLGYPHVPPSPVVGK